MSDERMYLSAVEVRRWAFEPAMRGYKKEAVDQFKERVAEELERLARVNQDLEQKARNFHEQLRAFRERDKALSEALISAQQLRAETREAANSQNKELPSGGRQHHPTPAWLDTLVKE